ncbi:Mrp/NBP35 family ATP-binding protein [Sphaerochaeta sp. S2]|uniref:Mrp/NBP35 family ATP-binding protein n=1 Tax=Sphaerochaeta sp. S2 TaxID=2798868 RepID=UPI0018E9D37C|nr:Mrp/NBP35 family ATP-binding protein [Sphaerochaeta sp. S2]MBJ2357398.1 Mrp/NBP35 family ATP-binding protein [Sphaerochaeta sp. S2]
MAQPDIDMRAHSKTGSTIGNIIAVVSGKGGVGKSSVTSLLASEMQRRGHKVGVLDADITGSSIPKMFGIHSKATGEEGRIEPAVSKNGIKVISTNMLLDNESDAVIWRGPLIANTVKLFYTDVDWKELDYLFVDMPPGTGDVPLTVFQSLPVEGIVMVTSPQELVSMVVEKAVNMAQKMNVPIVGLVENLSYFLCPDNQKQYKVFGESHIDVVAEHHNLEVLAKLPIDPLLSEACDNGMIEAYQGADLSGLCDILEAREK